MKIYVCDFFQVLDSFAYWFGMLYREGDHLSRCFPLLIWDAMCRGSFVKVFPLTDLGCYMRGGMIGQCVFSYWFKILYAGGVIYQGVSPYWFGVLYGEGEGLFVKVFPITNLWCYIQGEGCLSRCFPLLIWNVICGGGVICQGILPYWFGMLYAVGSHLSRCFQRYLFL
jgi:hypothetical protein